MWTADIRPENSSDRGAANGLLLVVVLLVIVGAALFIELRGDRGPVVPEEGSQENQQVSEGPAGKTAKSLEETDPDRGGEGGVANGQTPPRAGSGEKAKKVTLTPREKQIMAWEGVCQDPGASSKDKLTAIAELRKTDKNGEQFVPLMLEMMQQAKDDDMVMGMVLEIRKRKHAQFGHPLLDTALQTKSREIKIAAVRTLGAYLDEPAIKSMLKQIGESGGSEIHEEVEAALEGRKDHWDQGTGH